MLFIALHMGKKITNKKHKDPFFLVEVPSFLERTIMHFYNYANAVSIYNSTLIKD